MPPYDPQHLDYDSHSDSSSVSSWLQGHPELPHQYTREDATSTAPRKQRKRKLADEQGNTTHSVKHPKLAELSGSRMNEASSRKASHSGDESHSKSTSKDRNTRSSVRRQTRPAAATNQLQTPTTPRTRISQSLASPSKDGDPEATPKPATNISVTGIRTTLDKLSTPTFPPLRHPPVREKRKDANSGVYGHQIGNNPGFWWSLML